jgi:hypothetical protein
VDWQQSGWPGFNFQQGQEIFLYSTASRLALRPIQPPKNQVPGALSTWVMQPGREAEHSTPSSGEVKYGGAVPPLPLCHHGIVHIESRTRTSLPFLFTLSLSFRLWEYVTRYTFMWFCHEPFPARSSRTRFTFNIHALLPFYSSTDDILTHVMELNRHICRRLNL